MEELNELKRTIKKFNFQPKHGFSRLLIQLFGFLGNGKSSFINTCKYIFDDGEFINYTEAASDHGGHTTERLSYRLTKTITLVDNRGCATMDNYETGEIYAQLANLLPLDKPVEWSKGYKLADRIKRAEPYVQSSDFIFPVYVHSAKRSLSPDEINILRELFSTARNVTGNFPIVVFTHKTRGNVSEKERILKDLGVERVFAFENYTPADHIKTRGRHEDVLRFLLEVIKDVNFCVAQPRNPDREMMERKQLVYDYINRRELDQNRKQSGVPDKRDHPQYNRREETRDRSREPGHRSGNGHEQQPDYQEVTPEKPPKKDKCAVQ